MSTALIDVELDALTDAEIVEHVLALHGLKARLEGALVAATGVFDRRMLHAADAARTTAGWLTARVDQTRGRCGADVQVARALRSMPLVEAAFREGRLGRAKVDLLVETRTPEVAEVFASQEAWLVTEVADLRVTDANRFLRAWHQAARLYVGSIDPDGPVNETAPRVAVSLAQIFDGRYVLDGEMDAEHGAVVRGAIDAEVDEMYRLGVFGPDDGLSPAERRGQALVQIITRKGHTGMRNGRPRPSVEVICDEKTLQNLPITDTDDLRTRICEYADGTPLPPASLARLLCGADLHRLVISAEGEVLDAGKDIRLANRAQRRALRFRHARHCAWVGCDAPHDWCEAHHIDEWDPDPQSPRGRTDMANLVPCAATTTTRSTKAASPSCSNPTATSRSPAPTDVASPPPGRGAASARLAPGEIPLQRQRERHVGLPVDEQCRELSVPHGDGDPRLDRDPRRLEVRHLIPDLPPERPHRPQQLLGIDPIQQRRRVDRRVPVILRVEDGHQNRLPIDVHLDHVHAAHDASVSDPVPLVGHQHGGVGVIGAQNPSGDLDGVVQQLLALGIAADQPVDRGEVGLRVDDVGMIRSEDAFAVSEDARSEIRSLGGAAHVGVRQEQAGLGGQGLGVVAAMRGFAGRGTRLVDGQGVGVAARLPIGGREGHLVLEGERMGRAQGSLGVLDDRLRQGDGLVEAPDLRVGDGQVLSRDEGVEAVVAEEILDIGCDTFLDLDGVSDPACLPVGRRKV
jgi:hypothetical protein